MPLQVDPFCWPVKLRMLNQSKNHRSTPPCTHHMNVKMKILTLQLLHLNLPAPHVLVSVKTWGMDKIGKVLWQTNHGKKRNLWDKVKISTLISGHHLYQQLWLDSGFVQTWEAHRSYKMLWDVVGFDKLHDSDYFLVDSDWSMFTLDQPWEGWQLELSGW